MKLIAMKIKTLKIICLLLVMQLLTISPVLAAEGYRYMHVTIDTPWTIFLFLLVIVLFPFLLMAILYWYFAFKSSKTEESGGEARAPVEEAKAE